MKLNTLSGPTRFVARARAGFTLVEILVVLGLILIVMSLAIPALSGARKQARTITTLNSVRAMGQSLSLYATDSDDFVPTFLPKTEGYAYRDDPFPITQYRGVRVKASWFNHSEFYHLAFTPLLPYEVVRPPGAPQDSWAVTIDGVRSSYDTDYSLSQSFYAEPAYWRWGAQRGPEQWGAQRLTSVAFPDRKGMIWQSQAYGIGSGSHKTPLGLLKDVSSAVLWSDQSASQEFLGQMKLGGPTNHFEWGVPKLLPADAPGLPIRCTENGVLGMDR